MFEFSKNTYSLEECFDILEATYSDRQIELWKENKTTYYFQLTLPTSSEWYVDPDFTLLTELHEIEDIPHFHKMSICDNKIFLFTFFHSNALLAYEEYKSICNEHIDILIHYDDHTDMMPIYVPRNINLPKLSVQNMIDKSIIGIGNFITFFLHENQKCNIIHIKKDAKKVTKNYTFSKKDINIGANSFKKISVVSQDGIRPYKLMNNINNLSLESDIQTIWLDIDLDYFYNKFNRDSDWSLLTKNPMKEDYLTNLFEEEYLKITTSQWFKYIKILTVASSPGFFPVKYLAIAEKSFIKPLYKEYFKNEFI